MTWKYTVILLVAVTNGVLSWRWNLPNLPSGKRTEYFLAADGEYKYGYDTGKGQFAKQAGDAQNEVSGHYIYKDPTGKNVDVKYTAGVNGFVPEGLESLPHSKGPHSPVQGYSYNAPATYASSDTTDDQANTGDASYNFAIDTDTYKRQESSDASGNVQGKYSYSNEAGHHDLSYIAGSNTGFVATSGSLSIPNGLEGKTIPLSHSSASNFAGSSKSSNSYTPTIPNADGSYSFGYSTNDQSRQESSDVSGNVQGQYSYTNEAGAHDLSYVAGSATGFQVTGGSLAAPNGLIGHAIPVSYSASSGYLPPYATAKSSLYTPAVPNPDGSYAFEYSTGDSSRMESADASGNVQGKYSYTNKAGTHDLSYVAGATTGFQPTGGNLAAPAIPSTYSTSSASTGYHPLKSYSEESQDDQANTGDASYSFTVDTDEYKRHESSDAKGNVKGSYTYKNAAGSHELNYVAGSETGFKPVSGSLATPNGLTGMGSTYSVPSTSGYLPPTTYSESQDDQASTGDSSYNFNIDTDEYKRHESSDAQGNIQGGYTYKNAAGTHDLSYIAGSATGFQTTGGSLALPNGLIGDAVQTSYITPTIYTATNTYPTAYSSGNEDEATSEDASYSFIIDTSDYQRKESSDAQGNVQGTYSYKNAAGSHDLSYVAGSATGFATKSGSLAVPNGIAGSSVATTSYLPPQGRAYTGSPVSGHVSGDAAHVYSETKIGKLLVKNFQPSKTLDRYGYIFEES